MFFLRRYHTKRSENPGLRVELLSVRSKIGPGDKNRTVAGNNVAWLDFVLRLYRRAGVELEFADSC